MINIILHLLSFHMKFIKLAEGSFDHSCMTLYYSQQLDILQCDTFIQYHHPYRLQRVYRDFVVGPMARVSSTDS